MDPKLTKLLHLIQATLPEEAENLHSLLFLKINGDLRSFVINHVRIPKHLNTGLIKYSMINIIIQFM